jgi:hypothetical protein
MEMWRYFPRDDERSNPDLHPFLRDGKWRFIVQDVEVAWNLYGNTSGDSGDRTCRNTIHDVLQGRNAVGANSPLLRAVMARDDMRGRFANTLVDIMDGALSAANVATEVERLAAANMNEITVAIYSDIINPGSRWPTPASVRAEHNKIRDFAERRPEFVLRHINTTLSRSSQRLSPDNRYDVDVHVAEGGSALMNTRQITEGTQATGRYFAGTAITVTATPHEGFEIDVFTVNDVVVEGNTAIVDAESVVNISFKAVRA